MIIESGQSTRTLAEIVPTAEQQEVFTAALPSLNALRYGPHNQGRTASAQIPEDAQSLNAGTLITVSPYYPAHNDPRQIGHWKIEAKDRKGEKPFVAMISSTPDLNVKVRGSETTAQDINRVVEVLGIMVASGLSPETRPAKHQRPETGVARWLGRCLSRS